MRPTPGPSFWPVAEAIAGLQRVPPADLPPVEADLLGEPVEDPLHGEGDLDGTKAAEGAAWRVVRIDRPRLDVDVGDLVGGAGVPRGPFQDLVAHAGIGARVPDDAGANRQQVAVGVAAGGVLHPEGVALGVETQALGAREGKVDRPVGQERQQRRVTLDAEILLAAEAAAGRHLGDPDLGLLQAKEGRNLAAILPCSLSLGVEVEAGSELVRGLAVGARNGEACLRLQEGVVDRLRPEGLADDMGRRPPGRRRRRRT